MTTDYGVVVGEVLKARRRLAGLTQVELSERAGVKQSIVSLVENGRRTYSLDALGRVAAALGTKISTIMREAENIVEERCDRDKTLCAKMLETVPLSELV